MEICVFTTKVVSLYRWQSLTSSLKSYLMYLLHSCSHFLSLASPAHREWSPNVKH